MSVTLDEAEARLSELLLNLNEGEELTVTVNGQPYAKLTRLTRTSRPTQAGTAGCYRKEGFWMAPDFDAPMDENGMTGVP